MCGYCHGCIDNGLQTNRIECMSVVDQFTKILDKKSTVVGSNVRVDYRGNVMSNKALLSTNNGEEISKHGKL